MQRDDEIQLDSYLHSEMADDEQEKIEERLLADDDLFFEAVDSENDLVDSYISGRMSAGERSRFERSMESIPARRTKVSNARVLATLIDDERTRDAKVSKEPSEVSIGSWIAGLFGKPAFGYAMAATVVLLAVGIAYLTVENRRLISINANLQSPGSIRKELDDSRQREAQLQAQIESETDITSDLTADLAAERERSEKLAAEIAKLPKNGSTTVQAPLSPTIATLVLVPAGARGSGNVAKRLALQPGITRISIVLLLDEGTDTNQGFSARLNGRSIIENLRPRTNENGVRSLQLTISRKDLAIGRNVLSVSNADGDGGEYAFTATEVLN